MRERVVEVLKPMNPGFSSLDRGWGGSREVKEECVLEEGKECVVGGLEEVRLGINACSACAI